MYWGGPTGLYKTPTHLALRKGEGAAPIDRPPISPVNDASADPFSGLNKQGRPKRPRGKKITKSDIGLPSDFRWVVIAADGSMLHSTVPNGVYM